MFALLLILTAIPNASATCVEQLPQAFLIRGNMKKDPAGFDTAVKKAIQYRVEQYGFIPGITPAYGAPKSAPELSVETTFMSLPVRLHPRILPALRCAEAAIHAECTQGPSLYFPRKLSGLRTYNSYRGGEVSNHMFGLAVDVDPDRNPCCGCVVPWSNDPKCKKPAATPFDRAELPPCWVHAFERYGFYWLGWDEMQDTMHFEFLGDPSKLQAP
jgi:hypothetical protein